MPTFEPVLLARISKPDSTSLGSYRADGGYGAFTKCLGEAPETIIETVKSAGLRGRGGAGFPCGV
jgi:NADH-quinone oxidoreductase subunit F